MIVDTATSVQKSPHDNVDTDAYAYATSATSFMTVLTEVKTTESEVPDKNEASREIAETEVDTSETDAAEETGDVAEETVATSDGSESEDDGSENTAHNEGADTDNAESTDEASTQRTPLAETSPDTTSDTETPTQMPQETVDSPTGSEPSVSNATASTENQATSPNTSGSGGVDVGTVVNSSTATDDGEATPEADQPAKQAFPKTLNALLAENAVKQQDADVRGVRVLSEAQESTGATITTEQSAEPDRASVGELPPPPQTTATELGGVRVSSPATMPRVPLANLPGEIAQQIHLIQQEGTSTMRLRLSPENLGELRLEIQRVGDTVRVTMISASPQVRDALDSQMAELRQALDKQGLNLSEASVEDRQQQDNNGSNATQESPEKSNRSPAGARNGTTDTQAPQEQSGSPSDHADAGELNVLA